MAGVYSQYTQPHSQLWNQRVAIGSHSHPALVAPGGDPPRLGAKTGANAVRHRPIEPDSLGASPQVRRSGPRLGFTQIRTYPPDLLRDVKAAVQIRPPRPGKTRSEAILRNAARGQTGATRSRGLGGPLLVEECVHGRGSLGDHRLELMPVDLLGDCRAGVPDEISDDL